MIKLNVSGTFLTGLYHVLQLALKQDSKIKRNHTTSKYLVPSMPLTTHYADFAVYAAIKPGGIN